MARQKLPAMYLRSISMALQFMVPLLCVFGAFATLMRRRKLQAPGQATTGSQRARACLDDKTAIPTVNFPTRRVEVPLPNEAPPCPVCRKAMVRRTATKGAHGGAQFWGCAAFPACRGTR